MMRFAELAQLDQERKCSKVAHIVDAWLAAQQLRERCLDALAHIDDQEMPKKYPDAAIVVPQDYPELQYIGPDRLAKKLGISLSTLSHQFEQSPTIFEDLQRLMFRASKRRKEMRLYLQENGARLSLTTIPSGRT